MTRNRLHSTPSTSLGLPLRITFTAVAQHLHLLEESGWCTPEKLGGCVPAGWNWRGSPLPGNGLKIGAQCGSGGCIG